MRAGKAGPHGIGPYATGLVVFDHGESLEAYHPYPWTVHPERRCIVMKCPDLQRLMSEMGRTVPEWFIL